ncbi:hypothetical protein PRUPE_2G102000 [Prunus persica]|uniref:Uncharacterized protein n=1 Tax=Prunus persica TaxID=3760 RepID=M5XI78_PRUPE|nr:hypothetical protein PRUPE_2G102000 [Prunus persica]
MAKILIGSSAHWVLDPNEGRFQEKTGKELIGHTELLCQTSNMPQSENKHQMGVLSNLSPSSSPLAVLLITPTTLQLLGHLTSQFFRDLHGPPHPTDMEIQAPVGLVQEPQPRRRWTGRELKVGLKPSLPLFVPIRDLGSRVYGVDLGLSQLIRVVGVGVGSDLGQDSIGLLDDVLVDVVGLGATQVNGFAVAELHRNAVKGTVAPL